MIDRMDKDLFEALRDHYYHSDTWKNLCQDKKAAVNYKCEICGKTELYNYVIWRVTKKPFGKETVDDLKFMCKDCVDLLKKKERQERRKKKRKEAGKTPKTCNNCLYSSVIKYTDTCRYYLWCNKKYEKCAGGICSSYRKGKYKRPEASFWKKK